MSLLNLSVQDDTLPNNNLTKEDTMVIAATMSEMSHEEILRARITQLEERMQSATQRYVNLDIELSRLRNEIQEYTLEELDLGGLSESQADSIASICGFELVKEFQLEVEVQYSITVAARDEESALNLIYDIDFESVSEPEGITYLSANVDRVQVG